MYEMQFVQIQMACISLSPVIEVTSEKSWSHLNNISPIGPSHHTRVWSEKKSLHFQTATLFNWLSYISSFFLVPMKELEVVHENVSTFLYVCFFSNPDSKYNWLNKGKWEISRMARQILLKRELEDRHKNVLKCNPTRIWAHKYELMYIRTVLEKITVCLKKF